MNKKDRDYKIAQVLERELDDSIAIANIMSGIQHALNTAEDEKLCKCGGVYHQHIFEDESFWKCPDCGRVEVE